MTINYQQVYARIKEIGATLQQRKKTLEERRNEARRLLTIYASDIEGLRRKVESAKAADPALRCALPLKESLDAHSPTPELPLNAVLISADGSQIYPDRHASVQFGLINVGAIILKQDSATTPQVFTDSDLIFDDQVSKNPVPLTESIVALQRDLRERSKLLKLAEAFDTQETPVITFTDGPIELWGAPVGEEAKIFAENLTAYKSVLSRLQALGIITAGYVDKPSADLVVRLLEIIEATPEELQYLREHRPLRGVTDRWLFGDKGNPLLQPGERSAVFVLQAKSEKDYQGVLAIHFFYLNVGLKGNPWPVRVEIPQWVATDPQKTDMLHAVLISQCRMMGAKPFPYLLHRAHEEAVVKREEAEQITQMLENLIRNSGEETDQDSYKQSAKNLIGRTSY